MGDVEEADRAAIPAAAHDDADRSAGHRQLGAGAQTAADADAAGPASDQEGLSLADLEFHALRAIRYHEDRGAFLDTLRRCLDFAVVALGTTAVASLFAERSAGAVALNVATALIGALQLVANLGDKAQEHRWARRKFCDLLARVTEAKLAGPAEPRVLRKLAKRWAEIWGDEPATMYALEAAAYNATVRALDRTADPDDLIVLTRWQSLTRNLLAHAGIENRTRREIREAGQARG